MLPVCLFAVGRGISRSFYHFHIIQLREICPRGVNLVCSPSYSCNCHRCHYSRSWIRQNWKARGSVFPANSVPPNTTRAEPPGRAGIKVGFVSWQNYPVHPTEKWMYSSLQSSPFKNPCTTPSWIAGKWITSNCPCLRINEPSPEHWFVQLHYVEVICHRYRIDFYY